MKNSYRTIIIYAVTTIVLIIIGFFWWRSDIRRIKNLDYQTRGQLLSQYQQVTPDYLLGEIKKYVQGQFMYIIDEYQLDSITYEITGYSRKYWATSGFIHKVTIIGEPHFNLKASAAIPTSAKVYGSPLAGGALPFFSISVFTLLTVTGLLMKKKNLPNLFEDNNDRDDIKKVETEG